MLMLHQILSSLAIIAVAIVILMQISTKNLEKVVRVAPK